MYRFIIPVEGGVGCPFSSACRFQTIRNPAFLVEEFSLVFGKIVSDRTVVFVVLPWF